MPVQITVELLAPGLLARFLGLFAGLARLFFFFLRKLLGLLARLLLGLFLQTQFLRPRLGALLLALLLAGGAQAADRLEVFLGVVGAVVVVDLVARLDVLDGADENLARAWANVGFRVRLAGMVDVAGNVLAHRAVDGPALGYLEKILVLDRIVLFLVAIKHRPEIADDPGALLDRLGGEEAEPGTGAADTIRLVSMKFRHYPPKT